MSSTNSLVNVVLDASHISNSTKCITMSKKYVKRLLKISLLNILHQRINIPETEFETKRYEMVSYVVNKKKSENKFIRIYHAIGLGIMDAMEHDYLKEVSVYILRKGTKDYTETYKFKLKYNKNDLEEEINKNEEVKQATLQYIKAVTQLPGTKWNEDEVDFFIELSYNEDTPQDYEPPNFQETIAPLSQEEDGILQCIELGKVNTGYHQISAWAKGTNFNELTDDLSTESETKIQAQRPQSTQSEGPIPLVETGDILEFEAASLKRKTLDVSFDEQLSKKSKDTRSFKDLSTTGHIIWEHMDTSLSSDEFVNCYCTWQLPVYYETIKCTKCSSLVHLVCHGFTSSSEVNTKFTCIMCANQKPRDENFHFITKLRIILYGMKITNQIPEQFKLANKRERKFITSQLEQFGINVESKNIDDAALTEAYKCMFEKERAY